MEGRRDGEDHGLIIFYFTMIVVLDIPSGFTFSLNLKVLSTFFVRKEPDALFNFLVPRLGFLTILACSARFSWTYDTERVKHVIGLMGAPIFFHLSYGNYGTLSYSKKNKLGGIKLRRDNAIFRNSQ